MCECVTNKEEVYTLVVWFLTQANPMLNTSFKLKKAQLQSNDAGWLAGCWLMPALIYLHSHVPVHTLERTIDIEVSRLAIGFQKVCGITFPQCTDTTLNVYGETITYRYDCYISNIMITNSRIVDQRFPKDNAFGPYDKIREGSTELTAVWKTRHCLSLNDFMNRVVSLP